MLTVKEAAKELRLPESTIRYYTDQGLVPSLKRDKNNHRLFDQTSMNWLQGCHYLRLTGMTIENVKNYVDLCQKGDSTVPERYQMILEQEVEAKKQLLDAQNRLNFLKHKKKIYEQTLNTTAQTDPLNPETWSKTTVRRASVKD